MIWACENILYLFLIQFRNEKKVLSLLKLAMVGYEIELLSDIKLTFLSYFFKHIDTTFLTLIDD